MLLAAMASTRPLLVSLCLCWLAACSSPAEDPRPANPATTRPEAADGEPDLRVRLDLDQHSFPLTIWAAYIIQTEYFDKARLDPRAQLISSLTYLGLHTPEFFASVAGDQATVTVGDARKDFSLTGLGDLMAAADRLEDILGFTQGELKLAPDATHKLEYAAINGLLAPLDPHTILLTPEEHTDLGVKTKGQFGGIGVIAAACVVGNDSGPLHLATCMGTSSVLLLDRDNPSFHASGERAGLQRLSASPLSSLPLEDVVDAVRAARRDILSR